MILALLLILAFYVLIAPDQSTASLRGGAGGAIGTAAQAGAASLRAQSKGRSKKAAKSSLGGSKSRSGKAATTAPTESGDEARPPGRLSVWAERHFGRGGSIYQAAQAAGAAAAEGWRTGRANSQPGPPRAVAEALDDLRVTLGEKLGRCTWRTGTRSSIHRMCGAPVEPGTYLCATHIAELKQTGSRSSGTAPDSPAPESGESAINSSGPDQPAGATEGNTTVAKISAEAGLLQAAEQIANVASELEALVAAAEAARTLHESLGFDPGSSVSAAITALAEVAPDPAGLKAFAEMAAGLVTAIKNQSTALIGA